MLVEVIGLKAFRGTLDGKVVDSASLFTIVRMDERYNKQEGRDLNWKLGHAIEEWKLPSADHAFRLAHLKPSMANPIKVRLDVERVSNGRESREIVTEAVPVDRSGNPLSDPLQPVPKPVQQRAAA
ncbi:hypothetical protein Q5W_12780 [Hydrogenophaga sp. PBC]|uniref:hypothetical protein n=1 Tax=Hydrogenophaga sp. PBC TaxID=795665 RepID=UPI0002608C93|nr:hypothetical protein [Hydrogenophaga sp. PBC]AOS79776.1 hypothetical protein Q5W_12780 [Hydrogenophaga sp. PBC]